MWNESSTATGPPVRGRRAEAPAGGTEFYFSPIVRICAAWADPLPQTD
jgi:hypothetical protein